MSGTEKILGRGYATPEQALAPLRSARPWMKNVKGELAMPESEFTFQYGEGRQQIRYPVLIAAERREDRYAVVLRVRYFGPLTLVALAVPISFLTVVAFVAPVALWVAAPFALLVVAHQISRVVRHVDAGVDTFSLPYG